MYHQTHTNGSQQDFYRRLKFKEMNVLAPDKRGFQENIFQGPVVQSVVSLTSSLRVISLTVLADSIYNIRIFFAEKM